MRHLLLIFLFGFSGISHGSVTSPDLPDSIEVDSMDARNVSKPDSNAVNEEGFPGKNEVLPDDQTLAEEEEDGKFQEVKPVQPIEIYTPPAYREVTGDSLSRWQLWSHQGEWVTRQPGVISFQLGGHGRNDGYLIRAHESRHQRVYNNGILMNERIFGSMNRSRLPHYSRIKSVHEFTAPIRYRTDVTTQRFHVSRPLTYINYEQSAYNYRSAEGYLTRNLTPSTNISLSYWGKNQDEGYRNNHMNGRNASVSMYHFVNDTWMLEGGVHYSGLQLGEPDGYQMNDMHAFSFNRFEAFPNNSLAKSSVRNSLFSVTAYHRETPDDKASSRFTFFHDRYRRFHYDEVDSSFIHNFTTGLSGQHLHRFGPLELIGNIDSEWSFIHRDRYKTLKMKSWFKTRGHVMANFSLASRIRLITWLQTAWRTDGYSDNEFGSKIKVQFLENITVYASYAKGEQMPQPGQLYWNRYPIYGNPDLNNEAIQRLETGVEYRSDFWSTGAEIHASLMDRPVLVGNDSVFVQSGPYTSAGLTGWAGFTGRRFEFLLSGTFHQFLSDNLQLESQLLDLSGQRMWARASFYYKNYVYNSAAYLKTGFYIQASPTVYRTSQYYPVMDYWDPNSLSPESNVMTAQPIPDFVRLDWDMTARVRSVLLLFRLENVLDNWLLPGYFETAYQPMPSRRFRFGIRWILRN